MTKLSVNINKIATLRNARGGNVPNLTEVAQHIINFGADGITVHPRPDQRHIRYDDIPELRKVVTNEFNIEGNPTKPFIELVLKNKPEQVTLVPDAPENLTSNAGWDTVTHRSFLSEVVSEFKQNGIRTSIFVNPKIRMIEGAKIVGADRVELYTENYANRYPKNPKKAIAPYVKSAQAVNEFELGLNAGHDLSLENIAFLKKEIPFIKEVSIGHALICESLYLGLENVIQMYLKKLM